MTRIEFVIREIDNLRDFYLRTGELRRQIQAKKKDAQTNDDRVATDEEASDGSTAD